MVVCAPETPETRGLFGTEKFARMKAGSYFINIGRGRVVRLDPLVVGLQRNGVVEKHVGFVVVLEVGSIAAQARVQELQAKLIDAFVVDINALASLPNAVDNGIDQEALKRRLTTSSNRILGPDIVRNVVFLRTFTRRVS